MSGILSGGALIIGGGAAEGSAAARSTARYEAARSRWDLYASVVDECYEFALPLRQRRWMGRQGPPDVDRLFDSTATTALLGFASQTLDDVWPADQTPFMLEAGPGLEPGAAETVNRGLAEATSRVIEVINNSNFRSAAHETFLDYAIGTGFLIPEAGDALTPIVFRAIPLTECVPDLGPRGEVDALFHPRRVKASQLTTIWPKARLPEELTRRARDTPDAEVDVVDAAERDWTARGEEAWVQRVLWKGGSGAEALFEERSEGVGSCPFVAISYSRVAGEVMGRGPVMAALGDIKTVNAAKELLLEHADLQASGIWLADDDGIINPDTAILEPGAIIPRGVGSKGLENVVGSGDVRVLQMMIADLQAGIREALFVNDLGDLSKTPRSATEVAQRTADRARRLAGAYGRLLTEFLFPVVARVWWLLKRQRGLADLPGIDGDRIRVRPLSPLTRAQAQDDILRHVNYAQTLAAIYGQQAPLLMLSDGYPDWLADRMGVDPRNVRPAPERQRLVSGVLQAAQAQGVVPAASGSMPA